MQSQLSYLQKKVQYAVMQKGNKYAITCQKNHKICRYIDSIVNPTFTGKRCIIYANK